MKIMKRIMAGISALALIFSVSACGEKTDGNVVATVGDTKITAQDMRYYLANTCYQLYNVYMNEHPEIADAAQLDAQFSWDEVYDAGTGETYGEYAKRTAMETAVSDALKVQKAKELGITLSKEDRNKIDEYIDSTEEQYGDDLASELSGIGLSSKKDFKNVLIRTQTIDMLDGDYEENPSSYITDEAEFEQYMSSNLVTAKHILISLEYTDENGEAQTRTSDEARALAQELKAQLDAGADFDELMSEYNEDPGEPSTGYTFGTGEMVPEFEAAAFALGAGEVSDIVETSYGFHIIKRVIGYAEVIEKWKSEIEINIDDDAYAAVPVQLEAEKPYSVEG